MQSAETNMKEVLDYAPEQVQDYIDHGGKFNLASFNSKTTNGYADIQDSRGPSITDNVDKLVNLTKSQKIAKAGTFIHEKTHIDDVLLPTGTIQGKSIKIKKYTPLLNPRF